MQRPVHQPRVATGGWLLVLVCGAVAAWAADRVPPRDRVHGAPFEVWRFELDRTSARLGSSLAPAGDVNGDGYGDLLLGAPGIQGGRGQALVFLGSAAGPSLASDWVVQGTLANEDLGRAVEAAGDVNADGFADVVIGVPRYSNATDFGGGAFLFLGSANGLAGAFAWHAESDIDGASFAAGLANAGDVNGDGQPDLLVGAPGYDADQIDEGRAYLFLGNGSSYESSPSWQADGDVDSTGFGAVVSGAGDVNGDGYDDVLIGASAPDGGSGFASLYLGGAAGLSATAALQLSALDIGYARTLAGLGDVNGDGYADVAIGAPLSDVGGADAGTVYVYHGSSGGLEPTPAWSLSGDGDGQRLGGALKTLGDVNGDGYADLLVGSGDAGRAWLYLGGAGGLASSAAWTIEGDVAGSRFGSVVSGSGDINADGFADLLVGAPDLSNGNGLEGRAYLYFGSADGPGPSPFLTVDQSPEDHLAAAVAGAGDVNGDGYADLLVGAPGVSAPQSFEGRAFIFHGGSPAPGWAYESNAVEAEFGAVLDGGGDINGDGFADVVIGAPKMSNGQAAEGGVYCFLGKPNGLSDIPAWSVEGDAVDRQRGRSIATALDVNGDGFSDLAVGAHENEALLYYGSGSGLRTTPAWIGAFPEVGDWRDLSVAAAGDVNRDGFSDLLLAATLYSADLPVAGGACLYLGSETGLGSSPWWIHTRPTQSYGAVIRGAGDLDADGYADFAVAAPGLDDGAVFLYYGTDLFVDDSAPPLTGGAGELFGAAIGRLGDTNGDGFSDLAVGAPGIDAVRIFFGTEAGPSSGPSLFGPAGTAFGAALAGIGDWNADGFADLAVGRPLGSGLDLYLGNARGPTEPGRALVVRQAKRSGARLALYGRSDSETSFRILARGQSALGRTRLRAEWCVDFQSVQLPHVPTARGSWTLPAAPNATGASVEWNQTINGLTTGSEYHWRVRTATSSPYFPHGPWYSLAPAGVNELHVRTRGLFSTIDVPEWSGTTALALFPIAPNPARGEVELRFALRAAGPAQLALYDARGRQVIELRSGWQSSGAYGLIWDGIDARGLRVPGGIYFVRLSTPDAVVTRKLIWRDR
ncbi:MAG: FG-GAP repeat protein [Candidatus Eisenbacteria bacterium]|nr:FG-GAP repeat protein [Candidatus Eisenbacteria bacterium]MCC7142917.1 FG-GAP repeat protein [Candidatus Eisenbacteria bacterium]